MTLDQDRLQDRLGELAAKHQVVGATVAILRADDVLEAAYGLCNVETGVEVTTDSVFQIGSISKVWTATLLMQLVEEGVLALDEPVVSYLPDFRVADPEVTKTVTLRHLLCHSSGIDGDHFHDTGRGDDCLELYVASCAHLEQKYPLGATMSYCNAGYSVLGRVLEVVTGKTWDDLLRERVITPLGLTHTCTLPEEALRFRTAHGHLGEPGEAPHLAPAWGLMRSVGPAGLICSTARELLGFARLHLSGGRAPDGTSLLSEASVAAMQHTEVAVADRWTFGDGWGLGWITYGWGHGVVGHDGATLGQQAYLRMVPAAGVAFALLTNGGGAGDLADALVRELLPELAGVEVPAGITPASSPPDVDASAYAGTYASASVRMEVTPSEDGLHMVITNTTELAEALEKDTDELELLAVADGVFATRRPEQATWTPVVFFGLPDGTRLVHFGARATRKLASVAPGAASTQGSRTAVP